MVARIQKFRGRGPKGLPEMSPNSDDTAPSDPTEHNSPKDVGWHGANMITGNGGGPSLGGVEAEYTNK